MNPWGAAPPMTDAKFFNAARKTVILLVEGESDRRFWKMWVDRHTCQIRVMHGRQRALTELDQAVQENIPAMVAVLDADFDRLDDRLKERDDVAWTDLHDLETVLIASPAFNKVLTMVGSEEKLAAFEAERSVRDALVARAEPLGRLRWVSLTDEIALTFRKRKADQFQSLNYGKFCDKKTWDLNVEAMVKTVLDFSNTPRKQDTVDDLIAKISEQADIDRWQVCVGHDLISLLAVGLHRRLGSKTVRPDDLAERLYLAFERTDLQKTQMYRALTDWEARHSGFRIFAPNPSD